jgi:hypothetical protein
VKINPSHISENSSGYFANASDSILPSRVVRSMSSSTRPKSLFSACSLVVASALRIGTPDLIRLASCLVNTVTFLWDILRTRAA